MRIRNACFTSFNYEHLQYEEFKEPIRYIVGQVEECPDSGRKHFQGYVEFNKSMRLRAIKKILGDPTVHIEKRKGSQTEAIAYCKKEESRDPSGFAIEYGTCGSQEQGRRSDLHTIAEKITRGDDLLDIANAFPEQFIRYHRGIREFKFLHARQNTFRRINCIVVWGPAGVGKTRVCVEATEQKLFILESDGTSLWWDGYAGEETILIDDFYGWVKWHTLLRVLDGYEQRLPVKGGHTWARWTTVFITSNKHPKDWYERGMQPELRRRITRIFEASHWSGYESGLETIKRALNLEYSSDIE